MAVPLWALGRHLTLVRLTAQLADASGVLSPIAGAVATITGVVDEIDPEETITTEEISAINSVRENHVALMAGTRLRVAEIVQPQASNLTTGLGPQLPKLRNTLVSSGYCRIEWTHGGTPNDVYALYERLNAPYRGKGKQVFVMSFLPVDNGSFNWTLT